MWYIFFPHSQSFHYIQWGPQQSSGAGVIIEALPPVGAEDGLVQDPTMTSQGPRIKVTRPAAGAGKTLRSSFISSDAGVPLPPGTHPLTARVNSEPKSL